VVKKIYYDSAERVQTIKRSINFFIYMKLSKQEENAVKKQRILNLFC